MSRRPAVKPYRFTQTKHRTRAAAAAAADGTAAEDAAAIKATLLRDVTWRTRSTNHYDKKFELLSE